MRAAEPAFVATTGAPKAWVRDCRRWLAALPDKPAAHMKPETVERHLARFLSKDCPPMRWRGLIEIPDPKDGGRT